MKSQARCRWSHRQDADEVTGKMPMKSQARCRWSHRQDADEVTGKMPMKSQARCRWSHRQDADEVTGKMPVPRWTQMDRDYFNPRDTKDTEKRREREARSPRL